MRAKGHTPARGPIARVDSSPVPSSPRGSRRESRRGERPGGSPRTCDIVTRHDLRREGPREVREKVDGTRPHRRPSVLHRCLRTRLTDRTGPSAPTGPGTGRGPGRVPFPGVWERGASLDDVGVSLNPGHGGPAGHPPQRPDERSRTGRKGRATGRPPAGVEARSTGVDLYKLNYITAKCNVFTRIRQKIGWLTLYARPKMTAGKFIFCLVNNLVIDSSYPPPTALTCP